MAQWQLYSFIIIIIIIIFSDWNNFKNKKKLPMICMSLFFLCSIYLHEIDKRAFYLVELDNLAKRMRLLLLFEKKKKNFG